MYAINRLFYLSFSVKMQFFKSFILPYFDFGLSLLFYFSKTAIGRLHAVSIIAFLNFLYINCAKKTQVQIDQLLSGYNLTSLQFRIFFKFSPFAFQAKYAPNSPLNLKALLEENSSLYSYNIRNSTKLYMQPTKVKTDFGLSTFKNFYCTFFNTCNIFTVKPRF